jgi:hypothetical protein
MEALPNGLISILDRQSGLRGLWSRDGFYRMGDLRNVPRHEIQSFLFTLYCK